MLSDSGPADKASYASASQYVMFRFQRASARLPVRSKQAIVMRVTSGPLGRAHTGKAVPHSSRSVLQYAPSSPRAETIGVIPSTEYGPMSPPRKSSSYVPTEERHASIGWPG